jgi:predicted XRE-type DNA-binding protein
LDARYVVKAKLAMRIQKRIAELGLTQREAAARLPITQPKLALLVQGELEDISQAKLQECLRALGHDIEISIGPRHDGMGTLRVREHPCSEPKAPRSLLDTIADDSEGGDFDFDPPRMSGPIGRPVEFCDPEGDKTT